jgi:uncharacterized protein YgbK (DUF1537 family)
MIAVIADDLTGAAELAGIGLRYGLSTALTIAETIETNADLVIICTDSRSLKKAGAQRITGHTVKKIISFNPGLLYKKIDSVLRGHILDEIKIQLLVSGKRKALIVPANPSLGRTIQNGNYYIDAKPIGETGFSSDPEFAIQQSSILQMLKVKDDEIMILPPAATLPEAGIIIGEATSGNDIEAWAAKSDDTCLLAGAGDFFTALLNKQYKAGIASEAVIGLPHLYVSGTAFNKRQEFIKELDQRSGCVAWLPAGSTGDKQWINKVTRILEEQQRAVIAIDGDEKFPPGISALSMRHAMAKAVSSVIEAGSIGELFIEGGSTAAAVLEELRIKHIKPINELQRGVVRMKANNLHITLKPGSYELPEQIRNIYSIK